MRDVIDRLGPVELGILSVLILVACWVADNRRR